MRGTVNIRLYTELAMAVSLAVVLELISKSLPIPRMPYGGSVSLRMLPILVVAFRRGWKSGISAGGLYGLVDFAISPFFFHPIQVLLDYPVAFGIVGTAGLLRGRERFSILIGTALGNSLRFAVHVVSGVVFFAHLVPEGQPILVYSVLYNASYMIPEAILDMVLLQYILRKSDS